MKFSIVIPTYNQGPYIQDCLQSIRDQTYSDFEVFIQDSVSTDATEAICRDFVKKDPRFQYFREKDTGQSDAINRGLKRATGEFWSWICSDDLYSDPRAFETLLTTFKRAHSENKDVVGVFGDAQYISEKGKIVGPYHNRTTDLTREDFKLNWPLSQPATFLYRPYVDAVNGVDIDLHLGMDLDLFLKILQPPRKLVYVNQSVVSIRLQPDSKSVKYRKKTAANALAIVKKHFGDIGNPYDSAYATEYSVAKRLEVTQTIRGILWFFVPFAGTFRKKYQEYKLRADAIYEKGLKNMDPKDRAFMFWWRSYCFVYYNSVFQLKRLANFVMELFLKARGLFIR